MKFERPRGTRDFNPEDMLARDCVKKRIFDTLERFNYRRIATPIFEHAELFSLKSGQEIREHMYVFADKSNRLLCLRPEQTASVCRMFVSELRNEKRPLRLSYGGRMFRYERPQKGRYREFTQIGVELIGAEGAAGDAEAIQLASQCLKDLNLEYKLQVGHLGILHSLLYDLKINEEAHDKIFALIDGEDSKELEKIVDAKVFYDIIGLKGGVNTVSNAKSLLKNHRRALDAVVNLADIVSLLDASTVDFEINLGIARGLEYYTGMVFEIRVAGLGAENQIAGGGRYDNLIKLFGGPTTPAVGFAFGFDRVMNSLQKQDKMISARRDLIVVACASEDVRKQAWKIASDLRAKLASFSVDVDIMGKSLSKMLEHASNVGSDYVIIVGSKELATGDVTVKNMRKRSQEKVKIERLADFFTL